MSVPEWTSVMSKAYEGLIQSLEYGGLDHYDANSPAEFFAVVSEFFSGSRNDLIDNYPMFIARIPGSDCKLLEKPTSN